MARGPYEARWALNLDDQIVKSDISVQSVIKQLELLHASRISPMRTKHLAGPGWF